MMHEIEYVNQNLEKVIPKGIVNYQNASNETLAKNGYYRVVIPIFDEETQKLENLHIVGNYATYDVVDLTPEEIEKKYDEKQKQQFQQFKQKCKNDGKSYYDEIDLKITMQFFGRPQSEVNPLVAEVDEKVMPVMNLVKEGQWYSAMLLVLNTSDPVNQEVLDGFNEIKSYIINYVQNNYS